MLLRKHFDEHPEQGCVAAEEYFQAGVLTVGFLETERMQIHVHTKGEKPRILTAGNALQHPRILPGFSEPFAKLFETLK